MSLSGRATDPFWGVSYSFPAFRTSWLRDTPQNVVAFAAVGFRVATPRAEEPSQDGIGRNPCCHRRNGGNKKGRQIDCETPIDPVGHERYDPQHELTHRIVFRDLDNKRRTQSAPNRYCNCCPPEPVQTRHASPFFIDHIGSPHSGHRGSLMPRRM